MAAVKTAARQIGAKWYQAWGKNFPITSQEELDAAIARNVRWIRGKMAAGYKIYDIGLDPARGPTERSPILRG